MMTDAVAATIVHGSPQGYDLGCRSKGGCANHGHRTLMTCSAAWTAAHADPAIAKLPRDQALAKSARRLQRPARSGPEHPEIARAIAADLLADSTPPATRSVPPARPIAHHGQRWGFAQGCKTDDVCPNNGTDQLTCAQEHRRYYREYRARKQNTAA